MSDAVDVPAEEKRKKHRRLGRRSLKTVENRRQAYYEMMDRQVRRDELATKVSPLPEAGRDGQKMQIEYRKTDLDNEKFEAAYNLREAPLDLMHHRQQIVACQYEAGNRFRRDWELAGIAGNRSNWKIEFTPGGKFEDLSVVQADALNRVGLALEACGRVSRVIIVKLCGERKSIAEITREQGWPRDYTGPRSKEALDELAEHYGYK